MWFYTNKLNLNPDKRKFIIFGVKKQHEKLKNFFPVNILGNFLSPAEAVRNLGVWFDTDFFFLKNTCKTLFCSYSGP